VTTTIGITGAAGLIGSYLAPRLAARSNTKVLGLTRTLSSPIRDSGALIEWQQGDLNSPDACAAFVARVDAVVHLAHTNTPLTSNTNLHSDAAMNLLPTLNLIDAIRDCGRLVHVVYASSGGAIYGRHGATRPITEEEAPAPTTSYGVQKLAGEQYLQLAAAEGWLTSNALRIGNAYGVTLPEERLQGFLGVAIGRHANGSPIKVFGDPRNVRDYVHLDDVYAAIQLALERRESHAVYNIGSGRGASVLELIELIASASQTPPQVEHVEVGGAKELAPWVVLDSSKAQKELGWAPAVSLEDGIQRLWGDTQRI
jgi:UDP-glucose 4-epimerase